MLTTCPPHQQLSSRCYHTRQPCVSFPRSGPRQHNPLVEQKVNPTRDNHPFRGDINMIFWGTTNGDFNRARKRHNHTECKVVKTLEVEYNLVLGFELSDLEGVIVPCNDALVIHAIVANHMMWPKCLWMWATRSMFSLGQPWRKWEWIWEIYNTLLPLCLDSQDSQCTHSSNSRYPTLWMISFCIKRSSLHLLSWKLPPHITLFWDGWLLAHSNPLLYCTIRRSSSL